MKRTDYEQIAARYDENTIRHKIPRDRALEGALAKAGGRPLAALDVGCGTGNYLAAQVAAFGDAITWTGVDPSEAMLARAAGKVPGAALVRGRAESLPFADGAFDYVVTSFTLHHFEHKARALDEMVRVLRPGGAIRVVNVDPTHAPRSWVFAYFPEAWLEDQKRFWSPALLHHELEERGLAPRTRVEITLARARLATILVDAERRDVSELATLSEPAYARGLARLREAHARDPDATHADELALVEAVGARAG